MLGSAVRRSMKWNCSTGEASRSRGFLMLQPLRSSSLHVIHVGTCGESGAVRGHRANYSMLVIPIGFITDHALSGPRQLARNRQLAVTVLKGVSPASTTSSESTSCLVGSHLMKVVNSRPIMGTMARINRVRSSPAAASTSGKK